MHRSEKPPGSKYSSTSGLSPRGHLEYVKGSDGKVFGPVDDAKLLAWVRDGRVEPFAGVSNDLKTWRLASLEPSLEMDWIVENEPGRFYGPTHRAVVEDLIKSKSLAQGYRIYRDDHLKTMFLFSPMGHSGEESLT